MLLFVAGAVLGEVQLWQAVLGEVEVPLFVADALREVQALLFVAVGGEVLLRTTNYYSSTTKHYSSTTLYYKVLLRYCKSTTPVLL